MNEYLKSWLEDVNCFNKSKSLFFSKYFKAASTSVMDIFLNKDRKGSTKDKKTDWFYTNEQYDRKLDERADKNQYKF